jgi:hypothetical protein
MCHDEVPPVPVAYSDYGEIIGPNAEGVLRERTECPTCGQRLERITATPWHLARSHGRARLLETPLGPQVLLR